MYSKFPYDILDFIEAVESVNCIWDITADGYNDAVLKRIAWIEICRHMEPNFDHFKENARLSILNTLKCKWKNMKKCYLKSEKNLGEGGKKYQFSDLLQFLNKNIENGDNGKTVVMNDSEGSSTSKVTAERTRLSLPRRSKTVDSSSDKLLIESILCSSNYENDTYVIKSPTNKRKRASDNQQSPTQSDASEKRMKPTDPLALDNCLRPANECKADSCGAAIKKETSAELKVVQLDEDFAFFNSIKTCVGNFTEDEKLEFRMGVLSLMQRIKQSRN